MAKKGKQTTTTAATPVAEPVKAQAKQEQPAPKQAAQKTETQEKAPKITKDQVKAEEAKEKSERVQVFGLYFHNSKVLSTFLFFAIGIILAPIITYLVSFNHLQTIPEITKNQAQMYSGFISIGVVILFMIGYCVIAITDESNFRHEQRQNDLLTESEQKEQSKQKLIEAFEENALENGIKEVVKKQQPKPTQTAAPSAKPELTKKSEAKPEVKKEEVKSSKKVEPKTQKKEEQPKTQKKEEQSKTQKKEEPKKVEEVKAPAPAAGKGKAEGKKEAPAKKGKQQAAAAVVAPVQETKTVVAPKKASVDNSDDWNIVKEPKKKRETSNEEISTEQKQSKESLSTYENNDGFTVVKQKKTN